MKAFIELEDSRCIQNMIAAESLRPGDRLPSERDLADRLNVYTSLGCVAKDFDVPAAREIVQHGLLWASR